MALQTLPPVAEQYARTQRREIGAAVAAARRLWARMGDDFDASYLGIESSLLTVLDTAQERVATQALAYVPAVLEQTGQRVREAEYRFEAAALVATAGDGRTTDGLAWGAVTHAKMAVADGASTREALAMGGRFLSLATGTLMSDTARTAERVDAHSRRVAGFVRMLNPPSCGRCIILAGRRTPVATPFLRHPGCDCRNIPAAESVAGDLVVDPRAYLDDLDDAALTKALGSRANAQAYRDGADMSQLINAYRRGGAVRPAQVYGRKVKYTTEGTTRRGHAYRAMRSAQAPGRAPRLMPESIYQIAENRADAVRLLRLYGWIR